MRSDRLIRSLDLFVLTSMTAAAAAAAAVADSSRGSASTELQGGEEVGEDEKRMGKMEVKQEEVGEQKQE